MRKTQRTSLESLVMNALRTVHPMTLLRQGLPPGPCRRAVLLWGKAASSSLRALGAAEPELGFAIPCLVISPEAPSLAGQPPVEWAQGEHPLPGSGSLAAGERLIEFFGLLRDQRIERLDVFLSGGASSCAWLPPPRYRSEEGWSELRARLAALYGRSLSIAELNRRRSSLCALKGGGAAEALARVAPRVRACVHVLSDVAPFGLETVGSGPFVHPRIPLRRLADASDWAAEIARLAELSGEATLFNEIWSAPARDWARRLERTVREARRNGHAGLLLTAGEAKLGVPPQRAGRGGRLTHLASELALALESELRSGAIEFLCAASDGVDGRSGGAGVRAVRGNLPSRAQLEKSLARFDTATPWARAGALRRGGWTGTNVQDVVIVRIHDAGKQLANR